MKRITEFLQNMRLKRFIQVLISMSLIVILVIQGFYYFQFLHLTRSRAESYAEDILSQVSGQLDLYVQNVVNGAEKITFNQHVQEFLTTSDMERKFIELSPFVQDYLEYVISSNQNIQDIILLNQDGDIVTSVTPIEIQFLQDLRELYDFSSTKITSALFTPTLQNQGAWYQSYIAPIISAQNKGYLFEQIGYCVIISKTDLMEKLVLDISLAPNSHLFITDSESRILASNISTDVGQLSSYSFPTNQDDPDIITQEKHINQAGLSIYSNISIDDLTNDMLPTLRNGLLISATAAIFLLICSTIFMSVIMGNVTRLLNFLKSMKSMGEIHQRVEIESKNEIGIIAENVNQMLDQLDKMTHEILDTQSKLYIAEIRQKQMELSMLQSQINPHFLYNTLNCMAGIGFAYNVPEVVTIASAMSGFFRYCIKGPDLVEVREEIECVEEYLKIMAIRYQNKFRYTIAVEDSIFGLKVPKMILQPIVENALYHGIEQKKDPGYLSISAKVEADYSIFTIEDNGKGIDPEKLILLQNQLEHTENTSSKKSIGLSNIHSRIQLLYGLQYGLSVESEENIGTIIRIRLPKPEMF
ncbi:MAG: cache domain-containing sensor histidine kinase [Candidatus Merdivicinus sp.]|jgi:two-component system sensor histidine kinase YesM